MRKYAIAIDGPAGAGKSTISKNISEIFNIEYIDTGAMYRAATLKALREGIDLEDEDAVVDAVKKSSIDFQNNHIYLDGEKVDEEIRSFEVSQNVSTVAKIERVRKILVSKQRDISDNKSVIMDGRDIGSNVLKDAEYKFYLNASIEERARRRYEEVKDKDTSLDKIRHDIEERDRIDMTREVSPLKMAEDAIEIDSTNMDIDEVISYVERIVRAGESPYELL